MHGERVERGTRSLQGTAFIKLGGHVVEKKPPPPHEIRLSWWVDWNRLVNLWKNRWLNFLKYLFSARQMHSNIAFRFLINLPSSYLKEKEEKRSSQEKAPHLRVDQILSVGNTNYRIIMLRGRGEIISWLGLWPRGSGRLNSNWVKIMKLTAKTGCILSIDRGEIPPRPDPFKKKEWLLKINWNRTGLALLDLLQLSEQPDPAPVGSKGW